jgi:hypothetical protein
MSQTLCIIQREGENGSNIKILLKALQSQTLLSATTSSAATGLEGIYSSVTSLHHLLAQIKTSLTTFAAQQRKTDLNTN